MEGRIYGSMDNVKAVYPTHEHTVEGGGDILL